MFSIFKKKNKTLEKDYILWVTTKHEDGGYSSRYHGWSRNLKFTFEEALIEKEKLKDNFFDIEIVKIR